MVRFLQKISPHGARMTPFVAKIHFEKSPKPHWLAGRPPKTVLFNLIGFTFLNPHVYSDTVFIFGNLTKSFTIFEKINFGIGASISSFLFFYTIGYLSKYFSRYVNNSTIWKYLNIVIIRFFLISY